MTSPRCQKRLSTRPLVGVCLGLLIAAIALLTAAPAAAQLLPSGELDARVEAASMVIEGDTVELEGDVHILLISEDGQSASIAARRATLEGDRVTFEGLTLATGPHSLVASSATLDLGDRRLTGEGLEATLTLDGREVAVSSKTFEVDQGALTLSGSVVCPCSTSGADALTFSAGRLDVDLGQAQIASAEGVTIGVGGVPIGWIPSLDYPLDGRKAGLLPPELGVLGDDGVHVGVSAFVPLGDELDVSPTLWGRSGGPVGGRLRLRHAESAAPEPTAGGEVTATLSSHLEEGGLDWLVSGRGATSPDLSPDLRYDGVLLGTVGVAEQQRLSRMIRLSQSTSPAVAAGLSTERSSLTVSSRLWQSTLEQRVLWGEESLSLLVLGADYAFWTEGPGGLELSFGAAARRFDALGEFEPLVPDSPEVPLPYHRSPSALHRLGLTLEAALPLSLGPVGLEPFASGSQRTDLYAVPVTDIDFVTEETRVRQRWVVDAGLELDTDLIGRLAGGVHRIRPLLRVHGSPLRRNFGQRDAANYASVYDRLVPGLAVVGGVGQSLNRRGVTWRLDLGGLHGRALSGVDHTDGDGLPTEVTRLGGRLERQRGSLRLSGLAEWDPDEGLTQARAGAGWAGDALRAHVGLYHLAGGLRLDGAPWRGGGRVAPTLYPTRRPESVTGADLDARVPLVWGLSALGGGLFAVDGDGVDLDSSEWSAGLALGELAGCIGVELVARRLIAPDVVDVMLSANIAAR